MGLIFRIECTDCNQLMRFDMEEYVKTGLMTWHCWACWAGIKTTNLNDTIVERIETIYEGEE